MNVHKTCAALLAGLLLAAGPAMAAASPVLAPSPELAAVDLTSADLEFMLQATRSGIAEVRAGRMALQRSSDPDVRALAQRLVQDHAAAGQRLAAIARAKGVALPKRPSHAQQALLDGLGGLHGRSFDEEFVSRAGAHLHREAIAFFHAELVRPNADPALARFAESTLPVLQAHLRMAQSLEAHGAKDAGGASGSDAAGDARVDLRQAVQVVHDMKADPQLAQLLRKARGVLVLPDDARAALGVGLQAGEGVLVTRHGRNFSDPAFFDLAGISLGPQAGTAAGPVAFLLMTERAVQQFRSGRKLSLTARAGLTIGPYSARKVASRGRLQDVIVWSGAHGLYVGASLGVTEVIADAEANRAYYGRDVSPGEILGGLVRNPHTNVLGILLAL